MSVKFLPFLYSCIVINIDPHIAREAFVRNTDTAGQPYGVHRVTSEKIFNPLFPKAGLIIIHLL